MQKENNEYYKDVEDEQINVKIDNKNCTNLKNQELINKYPSTNGILKNSCVVV